MYLNPDSIILVFDVQKSLKSIQDIYPKVVKLSEGHYTAQIQLVGRDFDVLDKLQTAPVSSSHFTFLFNDIIFQLLVDFALSKSVSLSTYKSLASLISGSGSFEKMLLQRGQSVPFWVGGVDGSALPKSSSPGDLLFGNFKVDSKMQLYKVAYLIPSESKVKEAPAALTTPSLNKKVDESKDEMILMKEAVRDLEIEWLKKIKNDEQRNELVVRLEKEHGLFLPFLIARLEVAGDKFEKAEKNISEEILNNVQNSVEAILSVIDTKELAIYLGLQTDLVAGGETAKNKKKEMDSQKSAVILSLLWKSRILRQRVVTLEALEQPDSSEKMESLMNDFDASLCQLAQWLTSPPTSDGKYLSLWVWRLRQKGMLGAALKAINKYIGDTKNLASAKDGSDENSVDAPLKVWKNLVQVKSEILEELGWELWKSYEKRWCVVRSPPSYTTF